MSVHYQLLDLLGQEMVLARLTEIDVAAVRETGRSLRAAECVQWNPADSDTYADAYYCARWTGCEGIGSPRLVVRQSGHTALFWWEPGNEIRFEILAHLQEPLQVSDATRVILRAIQGERER